MEPALLAHPAYLDRHGKLRLDVDALDAWSRSFPRVFSNSKLLSDPADDDFPSSGSARVFTAASLATSR